MTDYSECLGVNHDNPEPITDLKPGDHVTVGISKHPVWQVIAVHQDKVWMFRTDTPWVDGVGQIKRLRRTAQVINMESAAA